MRRKCSKRTSICGDDVGYVGGDDVGGEEAEVEEVVEERGGVGGGRKK